MADFPTNVQDFDGDDRISFSRLDNKFLAVQDDGTEFEFDADRKVWKLFEEHAFDDEAHDALHQHEPDTSVSNSNGKRRHGGDDGETGGQVSAPTLNCGTSTPRRGGDALGYDRSFALTQISISGERFTAEKPTK